MWKCELAVSPRTSDILVYLVYPISMHIKNFEHPFTFKQKLVIDVDLLISKIKVAPYLILRKGLDTALSKASRSKRQDLPKLGLLLYFVAFFHVASLFSTGVDNEKAPELDNRIFFSYFSWISI